MVTGFGIDDKGNPDMKNSIPLQTPASARGTGVSTLRCRALLINLALAIAMAQVPVALGQLQHQDPAWVTTWTTSPSTLPPAEPATEVLENQSVRLIVRSSAGGDAVRLRFSNAHGEGAVRLGAVSLARQASASSIVPGSAQAVTFGGSADISIARWATVISDPVPFEVSQAESLAVTIYVPGNSGFVTTHALANQTSYVSDPGDHTGSDNLPVAAETTGWPFLNAIDVLPAQPVSAIVTLGDSITDGWGSTDSANQRWPDHFARRLYADPGVADFAVVNAGISGNRVTTQESPLFGQNLQARFERDVLALSNVSHIILLEGINDIGMSSRTGSLVTADSIIAGYRQIIARAHARGIRVIGATLLPYEGAAYYTEEGNRVRLAVNEFIRSGGEFDGVIEFDRAVQDPSNQNRIRADFTADNLHPNDVGYKAMADIIDLGMFR